jgi:hypothetical protein
MTLQARRWMGESAARADVRSVDTAAASGTALQTALSMSDFALSSAIARTQT